VRGGGGLPARSGSARREGIESGRASCNLDVNDQNNDRKTEIVFHLTAGWLDQRWRDQRRHSAGEGRAQASRASQAPAAELTGQTADPPSSSSAPPRPLAAAAAAALSPAGAAAAAQPGLRSPDAVLPAAGGDAGDAGSAAPPRRRFPPAAAGAVAGRFAGRRPGPSRAGAPPRGAAIATGPPRPAWRAPAASSSPLPPSSSESSRPATAA
jgi:hypothetical protein